MGGPCPRLAPRRRYPLRGSPALDALGGDNPGALRQGHGHAAAGGAMDVARADSGAPSGHRAHPRAAAGALQATVRTRWVPTCIAMAATRSPGTAITFLYELSTPSSRPYRWVPPGASSRGHARGRRRCRSRSAWATSSSWGAAASAPGSTRFPRSHPRVRGSASPTGIPPGRCARPRPSASVSPGRPVLQLAA